MATSSGVPGTFAVATGRFGPDSFGTVPAGFTPVNGITAPNIPLVINPVNTETPYIQSFSFKVQHELFSSLMLDLGYVGTLGRHLDDFRELNFASAGTGIAGLPFGAFGRTASTLLHTNDLTDNYNSLQVNLTKRMSHGLTFQGAYTYSKALGYTDAAGRLMNPADFRSNYGPMDWDRTHVLTISHLWELPFGTGHTYAANGILAKVLGDWQLNGVFHWATGAPFMVTASPLACNCPGLGAVPVSVNGPVAFNGNPAVGQPIFDTAAFSVPLNGIGNLGRNALRGPGYKTYDMSLFKSFRFMEHYKIEVRGEAYNLTNSPHFENPVALIESPNFGQVVSTANGAAGRQVNLALRLLF
jgi:hypothetical protein